MSDPFLDSLASALAGQVATALGTTGAKALEKVRAVVRRKSEDDVETGAALQAAEQPTAGQPEVDALARRLAEAGEQDPGFADQLRSDGAELHQVVSASGGGVTNVNNGSTEKLIQARDIQGGITFN